MNRTLLGIIVAAVALLSVPSPARGLTVEEAVGLAKENNHRIREYGNLASAERERVDARRAPFLPEVNVGYQFSRRDNVISTFQTEDTAVLGAEIRYNLFNGLGDLRELRSQEAALEAAEYQRDAVIADIELAVRTAYIEVLRAGRNAEVERESVELLEHQRRDTALFLREGLIARNELLKVEVELASARQTLSRAESSLRLAAAALERLVGVPVNPGELEEIAVAEFMALDRMDLKLTMFARRSELNYLRALKASREYARDAIWSGYIPSIDLSLTHNRYGDDLLPTGRDNLYDTETIGAVEISWTLFDGRRKALDARAGDWEVEALAERTADVEEDLILQLARAHEGYIVAKERLGVAEKAVEQAKENYRITGNQVREQAATTTDLLDARVFLTRARIHHNDVIYDLARAVAEIERVIEAPLARSTSRLHETGSPSVGGITAVPQDRRPAAASGQ